MIDLKLHTYYKEALIYVTNDYYFLQYIYFTEY